MKPLAPAAKPQPDSLARKARSVKLVVTMAIALATAFATPIKVEAAPSLVSFLAQKVNEVHEGERCRKATYEENLILSESTKVCHANTPTRNNQKSYDDISEKLFFETAVKEQLKVQTCFQTQAERLKNPSNNLKTERAREAIAANFVLKIPKLRAFDKELEETKDQIARIEVENTSSPMGETATAPADLKQWQRLKKREAQLEKGIEAIITSLWQGDHHLVRAFIQKQIKAANFNSEQFTKDFLSNSLNEQSLNSILTNISEEMKRERSDLMAKAKTKQPSLSDFELTDKDKIQLYKDRNWVQALYKQTAENTMVFTALTCRLEGRYGKGRERFYQDAGWAATGALALLPGGYTLAAGRGLLTMPAARMLAIATGTGLATSTISMTYEQKCQQPTAETSIRGSCDADSENTVKILEHENCALDMAMAALDLPFGELKSLGLVSMAFGMTRQEGKLVRNPQLEIWRAREAGRVVEAAKLEQSFLKIMKEGKMEVTGMAGKGKSKSGAFFVEFPNGLQGVWKPSLGGVANGKYEVAVKTIDEVLGTEHVALTVPRELHGIEGTVQLMVTDLGAEARDWHPDRLAYFDYLIGNSDRHPDNYIITKDGRMAAIDHGLAFREAPQIPQLRMLNESLDQVAMLSKQRNGAEEKLKFAMQNSSSDADLKSLQEKLQRQREVEGQARARALSLAAAMTPSKETAQRLKIINRDDWQKILGDTLSSQQLDELYTRQITIIRAISRSEAILGKDIYPMGPSSSLVKRVFEP